MSSNNMKYSTAAGTYCTTHDFKVPVFMTEFSSSKIISHRFHVDNNEGEFGIGYGVIIGRDLIVQLGLLEYFKPQILQWDGVTVAMKEPIGLRGKTDLTSREMSEVVIHTAKPVSTKEAT